MLPEEGVLRVETLENYIEAVDYAYEVLFQNTANKPQYCRKLWFRGLKDMDYPLLPPLMRRGLEAEFERLFLSIFKSRALPQIGNLPFKPASRGRLSYWQWLFMMQYYGAPTRLLDWTEDALVALVFAIDEDASAEEKEKDAAVWCLNPAGLNSCYDLHGYFPKGFIPNALDRTVHDLFGPDSSQKEAIKPCAIYGLMHTPRSIAQRAVFTIFPFHSPAVEMEGNPDSSQYLLRICIAKDSREYLCEELEKIGIIKADLMPELGSAALDFFDLCT